MSYRVGAILLLMALFGVLVFRAASQSITIDEAFAANLYLHGHFGGLFGGYDAAHHVLHTILCWFSTHLFGRSDFALRIPCLLGALLYFVSTYRLCRWALGEGFLFFLATAWLALNPLVLDFLCIARGYGLALGLFSAALYEAVRYVAEQLPANIQEPPRDRRAGWLAGLAVASNLTLALPVAVLLGALGIAVLRQAGGVRAALPRLRGLLDRCYGPAFVVAFLILVLPLSHAAKDKFYYGTNQPSDSVSSIVVPSLAGNSLAFASPAVAGWYQGFIDRTAPCFAFVLLVCVWPWAAALKLWLARALTRRDWLLLLAGALLLGSAAGLGLAHRLLGVLYPLERTGLYFVLLTGLLLASSIAWYWERGRAGRVAGVALGAALAVCVVAFALTSHVKYYGQWKFDAGTQKIAELIRARRNQDDKQDVSVGGNWLFEPALNYYRWRYRMSWVSPVTRNGPDQDYDYYVLLPEDEWVIRKRNLRTIYRDRISGAILASRLDCAL